MILIALLVCVLAALLVPQERRKELLFGESWGQFLAIAAVSFLFSAIPFLLSLWW